MSLFITFLVFLGTLEYFPPPPRPPDISTSGVAVAPIWAPNSIPQYYNNDAVDTHSNIVVLSFDLLSASILISSYISPARL